MRIGRTLPPAASLIGLRDILNGLRGLIRGQREIERFRTELEDYFKVRHCFLVSSGKAALTLILQALHEQFPERDEVVMPAFTCYSVPSAVRRAGLKIRLCDIDPETLDFDYDLLAKMLQGPAAGRILAVIPRHLFGVSAEMEKLHGLTAGACIAIVEDAAQTMGANRNGKKLGTLGDAGVFSLGRGKALSTVEGGVILTQREDLAERIRNSVNELPDYTVIAKTLLLMKAVLLSLCMHPRLFWLPKSLPFLKVGDTLYDAGFAIKRLSALQAGLARGWQDRLHSLMKIRSENARHWDSCLRAAPTISKLFLVPTDSGNGEASKIGNEGAAPVRFPVLLRDESATLKLLRESESKGLGIMSTYPDSVAGIAELHGQFRMQHFPAAKAFANRMLTFPTHPYVSESDKARISALLNSQQNRR